MSRWPRITTGPADISLRRFKTRHPYAEPTVTFDGQRLRTAAQMKDSVLVIGGGSVGMLLALLLQKRSRGRVPVTVVERKTERAPRRQVLLMNSNSRRLLEEAGIDVADAVRRFGCYVHPPPSDSTATCGSEPFPAPAATPNAPAGLFSLPTSVLEQLLREAWQRSGQELVRMDVTPEMVQQWANVSGPFGYIVGADGRNSVVRRAMRIGETNTNDVGYALTVIWPTRLQSPPPRPPLALAQHRYRVFRSRLDFDRNESPQLQLPAEFGRVVAYLGVQLTRDEYEQARAALASLSSRPPTLADLPDALRRRVLQAMRWYQFPALEPREMSETVVTLFPIQLAQPERVAVAAPAADVLLVGDAASGVHFFTGSGVNYGFEEADWLAQHLAGAATVAPRPVVTQTSPEYTLYVDRVRQEIQKREPQLARYDTLEAAFRLADEHFGIVPSAAGGSAHQHPEQRQPSLDIDAYQAFVKSFQAKSTELGRGVLLRNESNLLDCEHALKRLSRAKRRAMAHRLRLGTFEDLDTHEQCLVLNNYLWQQQQPKTVAALLHETATVAEAAECPREAPVFVHGYVTPITHYRPVEAYCRRKPTYLPSST